MLRILRILLVVCLFSLPALMKGWGDGCVLVQEPQKEQADYKFEYQTYDFGKITKDRKYRHTFVVTNTGNGNLVLKYVAGSCGCTKVSFTKDPIPPGKTGTIEVMFDPTKQFVGGFRKSISVYLNSTKSNYTRLFIKGEIVDKE